MLNRGDFMNDKKIDRRVRKTKQQLRNGFAELLKDKPVKDITVREIADYIDINRGTFYLHYKDIYDMMEQIQNEMFDEFNAIIDAHSPSELKKTAFPIAVDIFNYLAENSSMCRVLLSKNGDIAFVNRLKNIVKEKCLHGWIQLYNTKNTQNFEYFYSFIISGYLGLFETWLESGMNETPEEMAALAERLIVNGVKGLK